MYSKASEVLKVSSDAKSKSNTNKQTSVRLSQAQFYALHVAANYKLKRSSMGWWADGHPRWGVTEFVVIFSPATIKSLWRMGLLEGTPDSEILGTGKIDDVNEIGLWANKKGLELLREIKRDTGIYFNRETHQLVYPEDDPTPNDLEVATFH